MVQQLGNACVVSSSIPAGAPTKAGEPRATTVIGVNMQQSTALLSQPIARECNATQFNVMQRTLMQCNAMHHNVMQWNASNRTQYVM